ncbi:N-acetyl-gamma-glutamyl-phosphate reductase [Campylobacter hepaticus]|uniref:N-acetyl-gamma-glutamyl-phosphate reductase n=1 Tax=Campylobacter hepaticus TaxID=1813019 RepID=A0A424YZ57_9BACT|nr:N-acetyl-gamma-glutamyl-phosphate reductase [Campylobacter hepaticus]AXP08927.1 N-acetyl-gamma-glutamyl-phosphate reductase [Campylobacter hepaticus]MCZ0771787.1 N-acetyl-gamma-glutamyl-phosphate reductase [Campylobacter hepaticus]MCZ0773346.1 N-acetyl-gamma-glutamyl-phosphate reductase [Campylobacter hepaticus]MCZ0774468.1 N-acetyl-gamma-glutamyl-phosphate reductase [Campylobacter hepaticus]MCZ0774597.1 N-acetyl-gamma-glutamyl-phosphate reductase [Campylobacter hepaticus]
MKIRVGILGSSGYVGSELVRILLHHPRVEIVYLGSNSHIGKNYQDLYPHIPLNLCFENKALNELNLDLLFLATPHQMSAKLLNQAILQKMKIIDLSADFRLKNPKDYELWYEFIHPNTQLLQNAVYGLCELYKQAIKKADLIANPGCYTTCSILSLYPLFKEKIIDLHSVSIDAKSGVSGAGKNLTVNNLFCEVNENIKAYALSSHRHTPEIEEHLSYAAGQKITLQFTPHLIPMQRGILISAYANLKSNLKEQDLRDIYTKYYQNTKFIRLLPPQSFPQTRWVKSSNFVDINFSIDQRTNRIVVLGAIDNLIKGAAGQAVQNMNLMFDFEEDEGLKFFANL